MLYQAYQAHTDFYRRSTRKSTSARVLLERLAPRPGHLADAKRRWPRL